MCKASMQELAISTDVQNIICTKEPIIRLRELSVSYSLPEKWMEKTKVFKDINLSLVARNLFFFYKDAPFDPDALMSVGNDMQGVDVFGMPTTRSIGFNVKFTF